MKLRILALTAMMMICTGAPVKAETHVELRGLDRDGQTVIVIPSGGRYRLYHPHYRYSRIYHPRYRYNRIHRLYYPHYRYNRVYQLHHRYGGIYHPHYRYNRIYYPRRSHFQLRIGF